MEIRIGALKTGNESLMLYQKSVSSRAPEGSWTALLSETHTLSGMPAGYFYMPICLSGQTADYIMLPLLLENALLSSGEA